MPAFSSRNPRLFKNKGLNQIYWEIQYSLQNENGFHISSLIKLYKIIHTLSSTLSDKEQAQIKTLLATIAEPWHDKAFKIRQQFIGDENISSSLSSNPHRYTNKFITINELYDLNETDNHFERFNRMDALMYLELLVPMDALLPKILEDLEKNTRGLVDSHLSDWEDLVDQNSETNTPPINNDNLFEMYTNMENKIKQKQSFSEKEISKLTNTIILYGLYDHITPSCIALFCNLISKVKDPNDLCWTIMIDELFNHAKDSADNFKAHEIALVFNLISKMEDPESPQWQPLIGQLIERALLIANDFKAQEIALVFKLIAKMPNPDGPQWQPLIDQLIERAIDIAGTFEAPSIALVFDLIAKIDDPGSPQWQFLIRQLIERAISIADTFKGQEIAKIIKLDSKMADCYSPQWQQLMKELQKPVANRWENFNQKKPAITPYLFDSIGIKKTVPNQNTPVCSLEKLNELGAVNLYDETYYFNQTAESKEIAENFLKDFWATGKNRGLTIKYHAKKCRKIAKSQGSPVTAFPSCISFITATLESEKGLQKFCFVATSIWDARINNHLKDYTEKYASKNKDIQYVFLNQDTTLFNHLFCALTQDKHADNNCAEKKFIIEFMKLFAEHGKNFQITGASNCLFYPYQKNTKYGHSEKSVDPRVKPVVAPKKTNTNSIDVHFIPCCLQCTKNKHGILALLREAQNTAPVSAMKKTDTLEDTKMELFSLEKPSHGGAQHSFFPKKSVKPENQSCQAEQTLISS